MQTAARVSAYRSSFRGRRTNLDFADAVKGMSKQNMTFTLDEEGIHLLEETVAHARGGPSCRSLLRR